MSAFDVLGPVAERFAAQAATLGRDVSVSQDEGVTFVADPARIDQAVGNLVDNALLHGAGPVRLLARRVGDRVELHVLDEGEGFPDAFVARAFDRFSRADDARRRSGSGLGLAIVHAIAVAHGGTASVTTAGSGGADVSISLPLVPTGETLSRARRSAAARSVGDTARSARA
jgi:signal transduction histidine kinase